MPIEKDIKEIMRIIAGLLRHSEEHDPSFDKQLEKANEIFDGFNQKYAKLEIHAASTIDEIDIRLFILEDSVKEIFDSTASKIKGLTGIGLKSFEEATIQEAEHFARIVEGIDSTLLLTYTLDYGTETVVLEKSDDKVELLYEIKSVINPLAPQFQLIKAYGAEKDASIDILKKCYALGFTDVEDESLFDWEDEFYPKMLE